MESKEIVIMKYVASWSGKSLSNAGSAHAVMSSCETQRRDHYPQRDWPDDL